MNIRREPSLTRAANWKSLFIHLQCLLMCDDQTNSVILYEVSLSVVYIEESGHGLLPSRLTTKPGVGFFRPIPTKLGCAVT